MRLPTVAVAILFLAPWQEAIAQDAVATARDTQTARPRRNLLSRLGSTLDHRGIIFPVALTTEVLGNFTGGTRQTAIWESLVRAGVEIDFEKTAGWKGFRLTANGLYPFGASLTNKAVHDFNVLSNIDSYDSLRLYECWVEQAFGDGVFSIRAGQILADAEFFVSDYGALFLNGSFGAIPLVSMNLSPPIFPIAAPGVRLRTDPNKSFYAEAAFFSGNVGSPGTTNKHNLRWSFKGEDGVLGFGEIGYKLNPREEEAPAPSATETGGRNIAGLKPARLSGTYRLGGFYDSASFADSGGGSSHHGNFGVYFVGGQELWHPQNDPDRALAAFTRIGAAPNDRNTVVFSAETGVSFHGPLSWRIGDTVGLAFSYVQLSDDLVDDEGLPLTTHYEAVVELTYQAVVCNHVSIQPDLQFIFNPGARQSAKTAVIGGVRLNVNF